MDIRYWRYIFLTMALGLLLVFLYRIWHVVLLFVFGFAIAYLLHPIVDRFVSRGLRRDRVVLVLYILFLGLSATLISLLFPRLYQEANTFLDELPAYASIIDGMVDHMNEEIKKFLAKFVGEKANHFIFPFHTEKMIEKLFYQLPSNLLNMAHIAGWFIVLPFVCYFALSHSKQWIDAFFDFTPSQYVENLLGLLAEINAALGSYLRGLLLESLCVGFLTMIGLALLGVKGAVLLGFITGILNLVPFLSIIVGGTIAMLVGYLQFNSMAAIVAIFLLYALVRVVDDFILIPLVMGRSVKLHPVVILFAVLAGLELGGFIGLVFAIPTAAVIKVILTVLLRDRKDQLMISGTHIYS